MTAIVDTHRMAETGTGSGRSLSSAGPKGIARLIRFIHKLLNYYPNQHINRGFKQIRAHVTATDGPGELLLTRDHMLAFIDHKLAARRALRPDRQASAKRGAETRRARA